MRNPNAVIDALKAYERNLKKGMNNKFMGSGSVEDLVGIGGGHGSHNKDGKYDGVGLTLPGAASRTNIEPMAKPPGVDGMNEDERGQVEQFV